MPVYDQECLSCGHTFEVIAGYDDEILPCEECGAESRRVIAVNGPNCANDDTDWIRSITEVVEKGSGKPHNEIFLKNPTRANYKRWMKAEGVRHLEPGEENRRPGPVDVKAIGDKLFNRHRKRKRLEVR